MLSDKFLTKYWAECETAFGRPKDELLVYKANILAKVLFLFFLLACPNAEKAEFVRAEYQEINTFLGQSKKYQTLYRIRNQMMFHTYLWNYVRLKPKAKFESLTFSLIFS